MKNSLPLFWIHPMFRNQGPFIFFQPGKPDTWKFRKNAWGISLQGLQISHWNLNNKTCVFLISFSKKRSENLTEISQCLWCLWVLEFFFTSVLFRSGPLYLEHFCEKFQDHTIQPRIHDLFQKLLDVKRISQPIYLITHKVDSYRHPA